ncbi:YihY/virulence factor BrkB family protein [Flavihumibacter sp. R14]|nr:YihY/virulence factor BrkB family protein [Flavihumibacter soli]
MQARKWVKKNFSILKASFNAFLEDNALKMSASLAYYTIFSMAPLLMILISAASIFYGREAIQNKVFEELNGFLGNDAALKIQEILQRITLNDDSTTAITIGIITLFIGATGVFLEIQDSINTIWRVKAKPKKGWKKLLINRFLSFSMIITLGFLLIVSLIINGIILALSVRLSQYFPEVTIVLVEIINGVVTFVVIAALFGIIFKYLPDVEISWKDIRVGAIFTAILFTGGRYLISLYIEQVGPGTAYGAAGSLIVILVWVYYTAAILYFGAEYTQVYSECYGGKIRPASYAVHILKVEEEKEVSELPKQDHKIEED